MAETVSFVSITNVYIFVSILEAKLLLLLENIGALLHRIELSSEE